MLRRLILLLIFALAVPTAAVPACASDPSVERAHDGSHQPPQKKQDRQRQNAEAPCLGCVAPSTAHPPMLEAPVPGLLLIPAAFRVSSLTGRPVLPATPPPKRQA